MHKLSHLVDGNWIEHSYRPVFSITPIGETSRLAAGVPAGDPVAFERIVLSLEQPYQLLYVLHTPRGEGETGRYQSPKLSASEFRSFMARFGGYLSSDARFDIWAYSPAERSTIVWDRHNQLFGYGPVERFASELRALGFIEGQPRVPVPHQHHYRSEFDDDATAVLSFCAWSCSPLRPEDEQ